MFHNQFVTNPKSSLVNSNLAICFLTLATNFSFLFSSKNRYSVGGLYAKAVNTTLSFSDAEKTKCKEIYHTHQLGIIEENRKRNHNFFDEEVDKLEKWSEDVRNSIKYEIKELDKEIKTKKTEARKLLNLEQKVKEQRIIKDLEKKLAEKRYNQYQNEDDIENRKDKLLDEVEQRLKQQTKEQDLFTLRWKVI